MCECAWEVLVGLGLLRLVVISTKAKGAIRRSALLAVIAPEWPTAVVSWVRTVAVPTWGLAVAVVTQVGVIAV